MSLIWRRKVTTKQRNETLIDYRLSETRNGWLFDPYTIIIPTKNANEFNVIQVIVVIWGIFQDLMKYCFVGRMVCRISSSVTGRKIKAERTIPCDTMAEWIPAMWLSLSPNKENSVNNNEIKRKFLTNNNTSVECNKDNKAYHRKQERPDKRKKHDFIIP